MKKIVILSVLFFNGLALTAQTKFVGTYTFPVKEEQPSISYLEYNGATFEGVTLSNLDRVGVNAYTNISNAFRASGWDTGATDGSDNFEGSINENKYIEFSVAAKEGYTFTVDSIQFSFGRSATGPRQWVWKGSADDFSDNFTDYVIKQSKLVASEGVITIEDAAITTTTKNTLKLGSSYSNNSDEVSFRVYGFNAESTASSVSGGLQKELTVYGSYSEAAPAAFNEVSSTQTKLYPNPATNQVNIELEEDAKSIAILNSLGQKVFAFVPSSKFIVINVDSFDAGLYFVEIAKAKSTEVLKLVVK